MTRVLGTRPHHMASMASWTSLVRVWFVFPFFADRPRHRNVVLCVSSTCRGLVGEQAGTHTLCRSYCLTKRCLLAEVALATTTDGSNLDREAIAWHNVTPPPSTPPLALPLASHAAGLGWCSEGLRVTLPTTCAS